ncbi:MAG: nucleotide-binding protein [Candidatus Omnitrophica bacterium]|nr:nucleotide-binding protein [Candidatus Omnitrophota bacterium]
MTLPVLTTGDDVLAVVDYLRNKPMGASLSEAKAVLKRVIDPRKITGFVAWEIIQKEGERIKLAPKGWELARKTRPASQILSDILSGIAPYRSALELIYHQNLPEVTNADVAAHWHEHHSEATGTDNETTLKDQAVCFFRLCEAADLGKLVIGRKGQTTRFQPVREKLQAFIEAGPSSPPWVETPLRTEEQPPETAAETGAPPVQPEPPTKQDEKKTEKLRVFISHGENMQIVEQVQTMLGIADIACEVAVKEESTAIPVPEKVFSAMRRCAAGIISVTADERNKGSDGKYSINENVLIEIGAAFVLYDKRVVLLWDKRLPVPSNLQGLYRCEFEGSELSWTAGMKLMKAIQGFKK